jgi:predicted HNH restriction endonuclease
MKTHWKDVTRQDLISMLEKMAGTEVAKHYEVTFGAVYYKMRMFGIPATRRWTKGRFNPDVAELKSLYEQMPMKAMAEHYDVAETTIFMKLKEHGIGGISRSDRLTGKPKSLEHRLKMSESARSSGVRSGDKNGNWKGGVSSENLRGRSRKAYHEWKAAVLAKHAWKCAVCGVEHGHVCGCCGARHLLHAHHIKPFADKPELRYEVSNGVALCVKCHFDEHHK